MNYTKLMPIPLNKSPTMPTENGQPAPCTTLPSTPTSPTTGVTRMPMHPADTVGIRTLKITPDPSYYQ